ncbi:MAG: M20/M25/M40 family metallo-hydrolase [Clostridiales Family XIII bacterium]|jgi:arginine utilization protein RocB|nr:M20/M25/M40 family metallo-hydrolase [Clostridiales Family XIII bacterium]
MRDRILQITKTLVALDSFTSSRKEQAAADCVFDMLQAMPYFREHRELAGAVPLEDDPYGRHVVYGLVKGASAATVVLLAHYDVVSVEDYGTLKPFAFDVDRLPGELGKQDANADLRRDIASGEWIFGRGAADMKGGLAINLACLEEYARRPGNGNLLLLCVPDEESLSAGMIRSVDLLLSLRQTHGLSYELLIDSEPTRRENGDQILPIGTGGKCLPAVLVQGKKAHVGNCFDGMNALGILSELFALTELATDFSDVCDGEVSPPPIWISLRDRKPEYDVSLPALAGGLLNVLSFSSTPDEVLLKLKDLSERAFAAYIARMEERRAAYDAKRGNDMASAVSHTPNVMLYKDLLVHCRTRDRTGFETFYATLRAEMKQRVQEGAENHSRATLTIMEKVLEYAGIYDPVVILGFSPPYYPSMLSTNIAGKGKCMSEYVEALRRESTEKYRIDLVTERYAPGLSDCSYAAIDKPFRYESYAENTPLWGETYHIDFSAIESLGIPCMLLGPYGKGLHRMEERVNRFDLTERIPHLIQHICGYIFARSEQETAHRTEETPE